VGRVRRNIGPPGIDKTTSGQVSCTGQADCSMALSGSKTLSPDGPVASIPEGPLSGVLAE